MLAATGPFHTHRAKVLGGIAWAAGIATAGRVGVAALIGFVVWHERRHRLDAA